ncbi:ABC-type transport auxiliary lipoprotein family protein [Phenylobacterium sp.]|uniref:ABC-type transport auxiliary lipoprotein family protein n=1 Tax=Phenylobacterium sp. TaxID=1871053 RepID=UPI00273708F5|nr:ABC-type transport auxiliary lipoprotein family protein [Phenylobacterium sp.]MDP3661088.1 ABC-type transport auxiliary lipoprotein family protein [Phenylobacterium sp.]
MIAPRDLLRAAVLIVCAASLAGCISLLPKTKPSQLYRFEGAAAATGLPAAPPVAGVALFRTPSSFQRAASGDRILTLTGGQAAYIADARWVSPAVVLFDEALMRAFDANPGPARLVARGEPARTQYALRLDVRDFYANYDQGPQAAPSVIVRVRVSLVRSADQIQVGEQVLEARIRASDNRVGAIVAAFDEAVRTVLGQLIDFSNRLGASA